MTTEELRNYIRINPESTEARAYKLGLRDKALELSKAIEKFEYLKPAANKS